MNDRLTPGETALMRRMTSLDGTMFSVIRRQFEHSTVLHRELTGVGYYVAFSINTEMAPPVSGMSGDAAVAGAFANVPALEHGVDYLLWLRDGVLHLLEAATFGEPWPNPGGETLVVEEVFSRHGAGSSDPT